MRKHWIKLVVAVLGVLVIVSLVTASYYAASTKATKTASKAGATQTQGAVNECTQCHEMKAEVLTWQISAHEKFACTECHVNKKASDYAGKHQSQSFTFPIKSLDSIPNSVCLKCHTISNRVTSPAGDLLIPHDKHITAGLTCVKCHYGVVHAKIAERDLTGIVDVNNVDSWTIDTAKKVATVAYIRPSMWTCIDCHKKANVTTQCSACHSKIPSLPSHEQKTWITNHGKTARQDINVCINCHATAGQANSVTPSTGDKAADFARATTFCTTCHLTRPQFHEKEMIPIHPDTIASRGIQNCLTCHDAQQPKPNEKVPKVYCNQCHWFNSDGSVAAKPKK